jgi:lipopolysaccharide export system permease protein
LPEGLVRVGPGQYFLKTREVDFEQITRRPTWYIYAPTTELWQLLNKPEAGRQQSVAVLFHIRLTRPLIGALMVLLALAIFLRAQNQGVFLLVGECIVAIAIFYAGVYCCKYLGEHDVLPPPLAAWVPVMIAGPIILGMFDAVHT